VRFKELSQSFAGCGFAIDGSPVVKTVCAVYERWDVQKSIDLQMSRLSEAMKQAKQRGPGTVLEAEGSSAQGTEQWRIAILDDDPIIRNMLQRRLKEWRLGGQAPEVRTFADGSAFFEDDWHRQIGKYLLILDRMMPKINGIEVLTRLRADYPQDRYRIIMLTGVGEQEEIAQAMRLGTDDYVTKPFRLPELEARMQRILQRNK
jgi:CheY-like chemotaxis protein